MDIWQIRNKCYDNNIEITQHMLYRIHQRNISYKEIKEVIMNGRIIEDYPNDFPYPSCLVLGLTLKKRTLHVVVGIGENKLWLITAYEPDPSKWNIDFDKRKD